MKLSGRQRIPIKDDLIGHIVLRITIESTCPRRYDPCIKEMQVCIRVDDMSLSNVAAETT